ncbi:sugar efflux transporter [Paractinoplanes ferrugineus]|uniref:Sugar efflux transporter n=1 Tax=Paractinoplanes ferrugineus TaxID=113564 RepID=A0A919J669_9ACTN|nr:MFS transporter [Actinoplanes ferrugineus]GIE11331.1 putative sugar efflux transporter [Actinoplanes ferrugineus]
MPFFSLAAAVLLLGVADSMWGSYVVLFAADEAHLSPIRIGVLASCTAIGGIVVAWLLGRRFDRRPARRYTVLVTVGCAIAFTILTRTTAFPVFLLLALTLLGGVGAAFPQLFSLARAVLGDGPAAQRSAPLLRSVWSLAWAIGPLLGALVLAHGGYPVLLWSAAAALLLAAAATLSVPRPPARPSAAAEGERAGDAPPVRVVVLLTASVTLFFTAMYAGSVTLPLFVTRGLDRPDSAVGILYSVCAAVEVVAALVLAALPPRVGQRLLILGGMLAFVVHFALTMLADGMPLLLVGQIFRGVAIAVVGAAGIRYFQDLLAPATGRATTLFANAATAGLLVAGVLAGASVGAFGYVWTLALCGVAAIAGAVAFGIGSASRQPRVTA